MFCVKCGKALPEGSAECPFCTEKDGNIQITAAPEQKPQAAVPTRKKLKPVAVVLIVLAGILVLGIVAGMILIGLLSGSGKDITAANTVAAPATETVPTVENTPTEEPQPAAGLHDYVARVGKVRLTNGELMLYYANEINTFQSTYYEYLALFGLDLSKPLDEQYTSFAEGTEQQTWHQFFLDSALNNWYQYALLEILAENADFQPNAEIRQQIDDIEADVEEWAASAGYESAEEWLQNEIGSEVTVEDYVRFNGVYLMGTAYLENLYVEMYPTAEEIAAYYTENEAALNEEGIAQDMGVNASVRHILITPEGGNADGSYSDEEWAAALTEAEQLLAQWKAGEATEESFTALAEANSDDPSVTSRGCLFEDVNINASYVPGFLDWAIDENRKSGDTGIVKSPYGYHIMYFVESKEYWQWKVGELMVAERIQIMLADAMEKYPLKVENEEISMDGVNLG